MIFGRPQPTPHPRRQHRYDLNDGDGWFCACGARQDLVVVRRLRNNRKRGNGYEPRMAAKYGGEPVGPLKLPEDIRGKTWRTQVKSIAGEPPREWSVTALWEEVFAALGEDHDGHRWPRLLLIYRPGATRKLREFFVVPRRVADMEWGGLWQIQHGWLVGRFFVVRGEDWLAWFGKDE